MKILKKEGLIKKLILALIVILIFGAVVPNTISYAADDEGFGGKLLKPVVDLIVAIGDIIMDFIHSMIFGGGYSTIRVDLDNSLLEVIVTVIVAVAVFVAVAFAFTYGAAVVIPALIGKIGAAVAATGAAGAAAAGAAGATAATTLGTAAIGMIAIAALRNRSEGRSCSRSICT